MEDGLSLRALHDLYRLGLHGVVAAHNADAAEHEMAAELEGADEETPTIPADLATSTASKPSPARAPAARRHPARRRERETQ